MADQCCLCCALSGQQQPALDVLEVVARQPGQLLASDGNTYPARGDYPLYSQFLAGGGVAVPGRAPQTRARPRTILTTMMLRITPKPQFTLTFTMNPVPVIIPRADRSGLVGWKLLGSVTVGIGWNGTQLTWERRAPGAYPEVTPIPVPMHPSGTAPLPWGADLSGGGWTEEPDSRLQRVSGTADGWQCEQIMRYVVAAQVNPDGTIGQYDQHEVISATPVTSAGAVGQPVTHDRVSGSWTNAQTGVTDYTTRADYRGTPTDALAFLRPADKPSEDGKAVTWQPASITPGTLQRLSGTDGDPAGLWFMPLDTQQHRQALEMVEIAPGFWTQDQVRTRVTLDGRELNWQPVTGGIVVVVPSSNSGSWQFENPTVQDWQGLGVMYHTPDALNQLTQEDRTWWETYASSEWQHSVPPMDEWELISATRTEVSADQGMTWTEVPSRDWNADTPIPEPRTDPPVEQQMQAMEYTDQEDPGSYPSPGGGYPTPSPGSDGGSGADVLYRFTFPDLSTLPTVWSVQYLSAGGTATLEFNGTRRTRYQGEWMQPVAPPADITLTVTTPAGAPVYGASMMTAIRT